MTTYVFPDDLGLDTTHPDGVYISIYDKDGANLDGLKDYVKKLSSPLTINQLREAETRINQQIQNLGSAGNLSSKADKEKLESLTAQAAVFAETQAAAFIKSNDSGDKDSDARKTFGSQLKAVTERLTEAGFKKTLTGGVKAFTDSNKGANIKKPKDTIYLPMPDNLIYNEPVEWSGTDLGMLKPIVDKMMTGKGGVGSIAEAGLGQVGNLLAGGAGSLMSSLLGGGVLGGAALGALGAGSNVQAAIETTFRVKSNPFKEQTFGGVGFRPFEFSWTFTARSQKEVQEIANIIKSIRTYSKPKFKAGGNSQFLYPSEFEIQFITTNDAKQRNDKLRVNPNLPKLKPCICKSVNTNYTTAGWRSYTGGAPTTITLQLGFEEIDIITQGDVEEGF